MGRDEGLFFVQIELVKSPGSMLDDRSRRLLKTLIERYIADGQPVGSRTLSRASGLDLSPATIRNVMSDLEELGLIASPHTSAGRVPTARGYRLFVDTMLTAQRAQLRAPELPDRSLHRRAGAKAGRSSRRAICELQAAIGTSDAIVRDTVRARSFGPFES